MTLISHGPKGCETPDQGASRSGSWGVPLPGLQTASCGGDRALVSSSSYKVTIMAALPTSSKPSHPAKAPPPNAITLGARASAAFGEGGHKHPVHTPRVYLSDRFKLETN